MRFFILFLALLFIGCGENNNEKKSTEKNKFISLVSSDAISLNDEEEDSFSSLKQIEQNQNYYVARAYDFVFPFYINQSEGKQCIIIINNFELHEAVHVDNSGLNFSLSDDNYFKETGVFIEYDKDLGIVEIEDDSVTFIPTKTPTKIIVEDLPGKQSQDGIEDLHLTISFTANYNRKSFVEFRVQCEDSN